jgi:hypothetical protein
VASHVYHKNSSSFLRKEVIFSTSSFFKKKSEPKPAKQTLRYVLWIFDVLLVKDYCKQYKRCLLTKIKHC